MKSPFKPPDSPPRVEKPRLEFATIAGFKRGDLADILRRSYAALVEERPESWKSEEAKWDDFDRQAFAHRESIGKCVFVSLPGNDDLFSDKPIGLASYDPRRAPEFGTVGQNCVLPEFRGRGFGREQILEILRRFREGGIAAARVTTSEHPFFLPALRMYQGLGFLEARRIAGGPDPRYRLIDLELRISGNWDRY